MPEEIFFKKFFKGAELEVEDLFLLEGFQLSYIPGWVPEREFSAVLHAYPTLRKYFIKIYPEMSEYLETIMNDQGPSKDMEELINAEDTVIWTIADLLVYNKCPEVYDRLDFHQWDFSEVTDITSLGGKVVIEGGAGTGRVTLRIGRAAQQVFAVEPVSRLRQYLREKVAEQEIRNIFVLDGFLHAVPLPDYFADVFITSHALGWHLEEELPEIERVVKPGGFIIHCPGTALSAGEDDPTHATLVSATWGYQVSVYMEPDGPKRKYWKERK